MLEIMRDMAYPIPHMIGTSILKATKRSVKKNNDIPFTTTCPECFTVYSSKSSNCPNCGHENELEEKGDLEHKQAELTDIKPFKVDYTIKRYSKRFKR